MLVPHIALVVRDLQRNGPWSWQQIGRAKTNHGLVCFGSVVLLSIALDVLGLGLQPPNPSLGNDVQALELQALQRYSFQLYAPLWVIVAFNVPCFLAGWALLRPLPHAQALATFES